MTNIDQQKLVESLKQIEEDIDNGDLKTAQRGLRDLRTNLDVTAGSANTTIGIKIDIRSYESRNSIFFITSDHSSIIGAVADLVANHIPKLTNPSAASEEDPRATAAKIRKNKNVVTSTTHEETQINEEISIHSDVYYMRASVHYNNYSSGWINAPNEKDIASGAESALKRAGKKDENMETIPAHMKADTEKIHTISDLDPNTE